ncbi:MAG: serine/threonine protein kinase, partial [Gemmatimonadetes bacterium]|nr:serine/threonine protein kinase [Gemmatimonadota bacterium]
MADPLTRLQHALADRYRIERELGHGGMGLVFLAEDLKHGRKVALKVLRPEVGQSLGGDRFLREIRITAQLNHPNILTLIDSGEADGFTYYVLPYVEGESLRDRLDREKQLPLEDALRITRDVADALSYAHSLGVIHRDIKPENILFEAGHAVVADFGIAKAISDAGGEKLTESGLAVGTPAYMSPEQASGAGDVDARSDVYSLACVLYEMLAGSPPYVGPSAQAIIARKALEPVPSLRVVRDTVPLGVERAVMRALAKVPADRFATGRQFAEALSETGALMGAPARALAFARSRLVAAASVIVVIAAASYV